MAGIFDIFGGLDPEQQQGLLAAAAQLAQASGPSRTPNNMAAGLANAGLAYSGSITAARDKKVEDEARAQLMKMNGFKLKDAESDLQNQEIARNEAERLRQFYMGGGQGSAPSAAPVAPDAAAPAGMAQAGAMPEAPGARKGNVFEQRMATAERLRAAGFHKEADAQEQAALKFQPKVKGWEKVQQDGKVLFAPFYEDGTSGQPVPYEVAEKLEKVNTGGKTVMANAYTGKEVTSYNNTVSPDAQLSASTQMRGQNMVDARSRESNQNARAPAGYRWNARGELEAIPGGPASLAAKLAKAPTEFQGKSGIFGMRADEADKTIRELDGKYSPSAVNSKVAVQDTWLVGGMAGAAVNKYGLSENDQKAEQAQRDFVNAVLRQESGAAIGKDEFDNARRQYFPQPGDSRGVIEQKARNRKLAVQGLNANAGPAKMTAPSKPAASANGWSITKVD